tara:strand:- start:189 stop:605 length:417 start_codon:yes stop_codon:yes gene_type:complete
MKQLFIIRGAPGTGKTTLARQLAPDNNAAADDFFYDGDGVYQFDPALIGEAHADCMKRVEEMMTGGEVIAVHNTFTEMWEVSPYLILCSQYGYTPVIIKCETNFGTEHGVPFAKIEDMRERYQPSDIHVNDLVTEESN